MGKCSWCGKETGGGAFRSYCSQRCRAESKGKLYNRGKGSSGGGLGSTIKQWLIIIGVVFLCIALCNQPKKGKNASLNKNETQQQHQ